MTTKTYEQFIEDAYSSIDLDENVASKVFSKAGGRAIKAIPLVGRAYSAGEAVYRASKGDYAGAALSAAGAIPGPVGYAALAADIARDVAKGDSDQKTQTPRPSTQTPRTSTQTPRTSTQTPRTSTQTPRPSTQTSRPSTQTRRPVKVLAKKGGVRGILNKSTGKFTKTDWNKEQSSRYKRYGGR